MNNNSIVVYHSEMERMQDEFWMDFLSSNASWLQYVYMAFFGAILLFFFAVFCTIIYNTFSMFKSRKRFKR